MSVEPLDLRLGLLLAGDSRLAFLALGCVDPPLGLLSDLWGLGVGPDL